MAKVAILIPTYNSSQFIKELLDSLLAQTYDDVDIIISDDASTDKTYEILRSYQKDLTAKFKSTNIVKHLWNSSDKEYPGRNNHKFLFDQLSGQKYTLLIDHDDALKYNYLSTMVNWLDNHPDFAAVHSDVEYIHEDGRAGIDRFWKEISPYPIEHPTSYNFLLRDNRIFTCSFLCKTEVYRWGADYKLFNDLKVYLGDYLTSLRIAYKYKIGYIDEPLAKYRHRAASESHRISRDELIAHTNYVKAIATQGIALQ